jgi:hypothetical protein
MKINEIAPNNKAVEYLALRIRDVNYRGDASSQHNRYSFEKALIILELINKYAPNGKLMAIRDTDISKRPINTPEETIYAQFCDEAKEKAGIGTQDAMRKNIFVDFHRMGFIERYDINKKPVGPFEQKHIKYISLIHFGLRIVKETNIKNRYFLFTKGLDILLEGSINILLSILRDPDVGIDDISIYEYMYFVSAINVPYKFKLTKEEAVFLIKKYRTLSPIQRKAISDDLLEIYNRRPQTGNKRQRRDFHNWKNKVQQIFVLLNETPYFEKRGEKILLSSNAKKPNRSLNEKYLYFVEHKLKKHVGFELHHIIPLSWSESQHHFKLIDKWKNMLYIDALSHAKITQNRNRNILLEAASKDFMLKDYYDNEVYLAKDKNVLYSFEKQKVLLNYNKQLLTSSKVK